MTKDISEVNAPPRGAREGATLLLYAAVPDEAMLRQGFYAAELEGLLRQPSIAAVKVTNRLSDVRQLKYDGLICYFYSYTAFAALFARLRRKPVVATGGGEQVFRAMAPNWRVFLIRLALFWLSLLFVNSILATSTTDYAQMRKLGWFRRSAIRLSFHGADAVDHLNRTNFVLSRPAGSMVTICGMDTLENIRRKGLFRAIELLARIRNTVPDASLTVIGRTTCADLARAEAERLSCADAVRFAGYVDEHEKADILRASRYYVQLSDYEGFGIGALEALAMGCEVVHSNVGGLRDSVADYGRIFELGEAPDLDPRLAYGVGDWDDFERHMAQFKVDRRARAIMDAIGLQ